MKPVSVRIFDIKNSKTVSEHFFSMCLTEGEDAGKALRLFEAIEESFEANEIPWNNCASLSVDNTNAMEESSTLWHQDSCRKIPTYLLEVALVI